MAYAPMQSNGGGSYAGDTDRPGVLERLTEGLKFARSESMAISNDPRFFQDNVVNYRVNAFAGLSVVSGLLTQNAMDALFDMDKNMGIFSWHFENHIDSAVQVVSFMILCVCFCLNMLSTYIGVAQPYHTIRLMTSGARGFEASASYYLNRNITLWRHLAIKSMLASLPLFCVQMGLRLIVKFDRGTMKGAAVPRAPPFHDRVLGWFFCSFLISFGFLLLYVHRKHFQVFKERYEAMSTTTEMATYMQTQMNPRVTQTMTGNWAGLDV